LGAQSPASFDAGGFSFSKNVVSRGPDPHLGCAGRQVWLPA
jgi:nitrogenase subunit NifH